EEVTMKTLKWSLLVVLVSGVGISAVMLRRHSPRALVADANERDQAVERNEAVAYQPSPLATVSVRATEAKATLTLDKTDAPANDIGLDSVNVLRVRAER